MDGRGRGRGRGLASAEPDIESPHSSTTGATPTTVMRSSSSVRVFSATVSAQELPAVPLKMIL